MPKKLFWASVLTVFIAVLLFGFVIVAAAVARVFSAFYVAFDGQPVFASAIAFAGALLYGALVSFLAANK